MDQLIKITSVPVQYELKTTHARLEYQNAQAELEIHRKDDGGLSIKSRPVKLNLDTFEARNSILASPSTNIKQFAGEGLEAAYSATAQLAQEGRLMLKTKIGEGDAAIDQIMAQRTAPPSGDFQLGFIPATGPDIEYEAADLTINYEMDKLNFDLKIANGNFEFIPGDIEMVITQQPEIHIEYVGGPIYVPPSADPDHEPLDVRA